MRTDALRLFSPTVAVEYRVQPLLKVLGAKLTLAEGASIPPAALAAVNSANARPVSLSDKGAVSEVLLKVVPLFAAFPSCAHGFVVGEVVGMGIAEESSAVLTHVVPE